ncbi:bacillithiol biosynthesis cysteine-adding enzyme BshC [Lentibacillus sediminis]|uniref:bacillithiol biosynthesis cysteine-adding enzyme BshC n=1 Tax=Lentibacillus sediminis TaxID=1940529 RepID=UPI000C1C388D|nr:bacillithiol biosynthesis cysteine-adding enzyme BshC [Lentibacillus sediminis]
MQIDPIHTKKQSSLIQDYLMEKKKIMQFFDYAPSNSAKERAEEVLKREYQRNRLADTLESMNRKWDAPEATRKNIERLKSADSLTVIGGQQAGLLTGPLYTVNKIISIIHYAKKQENDLGIPVIPVFWIAGEDHDWEEVNHIFLPKDQGMKKFKHPQHAEGKYSVSQMKIDKKASEEWLAHLFEQLRETSHTKPLFEKMLSCLEEAETYTDFFARIIYQLFPKEGLVLVDSADRTLREQESSHFLQLIEHQPEISSGVSQSIDQLKEQKYTLTLEAEREDAHLFYHLNGERILLTRNEHGEWIGKQQEVKLSTEELASIAKSKPHLLSNNVVTRPLMQEMLFPTLAFIGGPGEIAYWAALKPAFHRLEMTMPPVILRLSLTFLEPAARKALRKFDITASQAIDGETEEIKRQWLAAKSNPDVEQLSEEIKQTINHAHKPLRDAAKDVRSDLADMAEKNLLYLYKDIDFLRKRIIKALEEKYEMELAEFDRIHTAFHPLGGLQERVWNPLTLLNTYGEDLFERVLEETLTPEANHYLVYL